MKRRLSRLLTMGGATQTLRDWAHAYSLTPRIVRARLRRGWRPADAVTSPRAGVPVQVRVRR